MCSLVPKLHVAEPAPGFPPEFPLDHPPAQIWLSRWGRAVARGFRQGDARWMLWPQLAVFRFGWPDESFITAYPELDAPLENVWDTYRRSVLPMAMQVAGWEALHASAIVCAGGVVVFCAVSETGKSTVAYGLRRRGFPQWADDGVVIRRAASFETMPLPFQARLRPGSHELLGHERPEYFRYTHNDPGEQTYTEPAPIRAICMLHRDEHLEDGTPARIAPMPLSAAFTAALTHAHEFDPSDAERRAEMVQTYLRLVAEIPTFDVTFRPDRQSIDALFDAIIERLGLELPVASTAG